MYPPCWFTKNWVAYLSMDSELPPAPQSAIERWLAALRLNGFSGVCCKIAHIAEAVRSAAKSF
jgi:hypothetical protein